jgi:quinolinate synthase
MRFLEEKVRTLCKERKAVILAHNYTLPEVQDLADFVGDSLELAMRAASTQAEVIVFCGVHFMAETAKILNPGRRVLMPDPGAGCPMADMVTAEALRETKARHPGCAVVSYVNTTAAVKAESDICCTSSNARAIVATIPPGQPVLFVPDRNLGGWVQEATNHPMTLWAGHCPTHQRLLPEFVEQVRKAHPDALLVVHPECTAAVRAMADHIASTSGILSFCRSSARTEFIIGTEEGILHRLRRENPGKIFHVAGPHLKCPNMKLSTVEKILWCLEDLTGEVTVDEKTAERARVAIERMLQTTARTVSGKEPH